MTNVNAAADWRMELSRARTHRDHGSEEFLTAVARVAELVPQRDIAAQLKASQPQVSRWAAKGRDLIQVLEGGKLGRSPYHVAERYSKGEITREQLVDALVHWDYPPTNNKTQGLHDDLLISVPGSFDDVVAAYMDHLFDDEIYEEIYEEIRLGKKAFRNTAAAS